jgi:hypothetical protein
MSNGISTDESLRYPIGRWRRPGVFYEKDIPPQIAVIDGFPEKIRQAVSDLDDATLEKTYRPGGWTVRQVVHHCADSHMNALIRVKLALTEDNPTIKPYFEDRWAELPDGRSLPVEVSLRLISGVHTRLVTVLNSMTPSQWERTYFHPENGETYHLYQVVSLYAWHCNHHLGHISLALKAANL